MTDIFSKEKRSQIMFKIRGKWTKPERRFYEENPEAIPHPDFLLDGKAVFLDSSFWHGYVRAEKYIGMKEYWQDKLFRNIVRDEYADAFYEYLNLLDRRLII